MAPCVVVERLQGNQQCSRAPVGEHAEVQAQDAECGCHEQQEVNEKRPKPRNSPSHNHDNTAPRQHPLIYTGAGPIHPVHGPLWWPAMKAIAPKGFTFSPFWRAFGWSVATCAVLPPVLCFILTCPFGACCFCCFFGFGCLSFSRLNCASRRTYSSSTSRRLFLSLFLPSLPTGKSLVRLADVAEDPTAPEGFGTSSKT